MALIDHAPGLLLVVESLVHSLMASTAQDLALLLVVEEAVVGDLDLMP